jgi:ribosomal protein S12 methylthiotransferase accessory factor
MAAAGIRLYQHMEEDPSSGLVSRIHLDIQLPPDFPESYKAAVIRAAQQCKVKKQLEHPPVVDVRILVSGGASS